MSLSNRVSLDTDVVFLRNIFMFSTNTNNVPVSTNFIMGAGAYGQITAVDTLRNLETYGVGYLPSTLSSLTGQTLSVSQVVASSFATSNQLFSVQNYLLSTISSTNNDLNTFSSYVVNELLPSTVSSITTTLSSLNSSFLGYVVGTSITQAQLFSTSAALIINTGNQISSYSTTSGVALATTCNYILANTASLSSFSTLSSFVGSTFTTNNAAIISTGQNFVALSNFVRLTTQSNSTYLANVSATVSALIDEVNILSSLAQNPLTTIGVMSSLSNVRFGSNIDISSINSNYQFGISTFTGPSIFMSTGTFSSLSAASGYISSFAAMIISSAEILVSSVLAKQIAIGTVASNYELDVGGSINFSGTLYQNGALYPPIPVEVNVLGTLSTSAASNVWFNSNINVSSINSYILFRDNALIASTLSASTINAYDISSVVISTGTVRAEQLSSQQLFTSSIVGYTLAANTIAANDGYFVNILSSAVMLTSSIQGQQISLNTVGSNYALDVGGSAKVHSLDVTGTAQIGLAISTGYILSGEVSSQQMYTSSLRAIGIVTDKVDTQIFNTTTVNANGINTNGVSTGYILSGEVSSQQMYTSSLQALQIAIGTVASNYALDVGGSINFTGGLYSNGTLFTSGGSGGSVIGELSTSAAANVWFNSNINISSINNNIYLSNGGIGIGTQTGIQTSGLIVTGPTILSNSFVVQGTATLQSTLNLYPHNSGFGPRNLIITTRVTPRVGINILNPNFDLDVGGVINASTVIGRSSISTALLQVSSIQAQQIALNTVGSNFVLDVNGETKVSTLSVTGPATFSNTATPLRMSNSGSVNSIDFSLTGSGGPYITLQSSDAATGQNYPMIAFSNSGTAQRYRLGLGNNTGGGGWTANQLTLYTLNTVETIALGISSNGRIGIVAAADSSNALRVGGSAFVTTNFAAGINGTDNVLYVDDGNNNVGINCNAPNSAFALDVNGWTDINGALYVTSGTFLNQVLQVGQENTYPLFKVKTNGGVGQNYVEINGVNTGASNHIFEVGGPSQFHSSISTLYTLQSSPRAWSYYNTGTLPPTNGTNITVTYNYSNYEPAGLSTRQTGGGYSILYPGVYHIQFSCGTDVERLANVIVSLGSLYKGTLRTQSNAVGGDSANDKNSQSISFSVIDTFIATDIIFANYQTSFAFFTTDIFNPQLTIQYLG